LNGLFWTAQLRGEDFSTSHHGMGGRLRARGVPVIDSFQFGGANVFPATVDFDVRWDAVGPAEELGKGEGVDPTDPAAFLGRFAPARSVGRFSGSQLGFRFRSNPGASSDQGYAQIGTERNGSFL
jgi:hypothetical protein